MNPIIEELISFYRQWINRLQIESRLIAARMTSQEERREVLDTCNKRVLFLRKCIAYYKVHNAG